MLAAGGMVSVSFAHPAILYNATTPQDQATLILVSQEVQAIYNEMDVVGGIMLSVS